MILFCKKKNSQTADFRTPEHNSYQFNEYQKGKMNYHTLHKEICLSKIKKKGLPLGFVRDVQLLGLTLSYHQPN
jgi:hypothetical protein